MLGSKCLSSFLTYYHLNNHTIAIRIKNFQVCLDGNCCVWQIGGIFLLCAVWPCKNFPFCAVWPCENFPFCAHKMTAVMEYMMHKYLTNVKKSFTFCFCTVTGWTVKWLFPYFCRETDSLARNASVREQFVEHNINDCIVMKRFNIETLFSLGYKSEYPQRQLIFGYIVVR